MNKKEFAKLLKFPDEWIESGMLTDELFSAQLHLEELDPMNGGWEHYRLGAFIYWLNKNPTLEEIAVLVRLSFLDPDQLMASDARRKILETKKCDSHILSLLKKDAYIASLLKSG